MIILLLLLVGGWSNMHRHVFDRPPAEFRPIIAPGALRMAEPEQRGSFTAREWCHATSPKGFGPDGQSASPAARLRCDLL
jgi:hypothetical protein